MKRITKIRLLSVVALICLAFLFFATVDIQSHGFKQLVGIVWIGGGALLILGFLLLALFEWLCDAVAGLDRFLDDIYLWFFPADEVVPVEQIEEPRLLPEADPSILGEQLGVLGAWSNSSSPFRLSTEDEKRHAYTIGSSGAGKTSAMERQIMAAVAARETVLVLNEKADGAERLLRLLAAQPEVWSRVSLFEASSATVGINPLVGEGDPYTRAIQMFGILAHQVDMSGVQVSHTALNALLAVAEAGGNLADVGQLLANGAFRSKLLARVRNEEVLAFFDDYEGLPQSTKNQWRLPIANKLGPFLGTPALRRILTNRTVLPFGELLDSPGEIIVINLNGEALHRGAHLLGGLLVATLQNAIFARAKQPESKRNPVTAYLDEFQNFAGDNFIPLLAEGRRYKLRLRLANQSLAQISPALRQMILSNVGTTTIMQVGGQDAAELSREIVCSLNRDEVRRSLMQQPVAEGCVLRRGQDVRRVRNYLPIAPTVSDVAVEELRRQAVSRFVSGLPGSDEDDDSGQEVRHGRRPA